MSADLTASFDAVRATFDAAERLGVSHDALLELDRALRAHLQPIAAGMLATLASRDGFTTRVRTALTALMANGACAVEDVARELAVSPRTLQRRLEKEGTSFGALVDDTRRAAALQHLHDPRVPIKEAAFRVGFAEPSTFYRAFRRWTGETPASYRRSLSRELARPSNLGEQHV